MSKSKSNLCHLINVEITNTDKNRNIQQNLTVVKKEHVIIMKYLYTITWNLF